MTTATKPAKRPGNICFSSGPCAKRPGWSLQALENAFLGRSHRAKDGKARLKLAIDKTKALLGLPPGYLCAIVPASDTGAFEMAMWSMLGARGVEALAWESFGKGWVTDVAKQLKLKDFKATKAEYGKLPDLAKVDFERDVLFTWNGTTSGVRVPNGDWIAANRAGLTFVDATSAVFAQADRLVEGRCADLLLAEGAGRRGRARHADPVAARGGAARELHAAVAAAEDLPPDQGRQADRRRVRGRDHQHAVHAVRGGLPRHARLGREHRRGEGADRARRRQRQGAVRLDRARRRGSRTWRPIRRRAPTPRCA